MPAVTDNALHEWIAAELAEFEIPGAAVAYVAPGRERVFSFGARRIGEPAQVTSDTAFSLASCSKAFTAYAVAILVDRGVIRFDDPVRRYIPEFTLDTPALSERATVRDLLGMRLGLQPLGACRWARSRSLSHAEILSRLQYLPRAVPFREGFVYFNPAYSALAEIITRTSGTMFAEFVTKELFHSLGMKNTFIEEGAVTDRPNVASPHVKTAHGMIALSYPHCGGREGESCQFISAADYLPWLRLNLVGTLPNGDRLISKEIEAEVRAIQMPIPMPTGEAGYCMGWMRGVDDGKVVFSHEGGEFGASTFSIFCPDEQIGVAVLLSRRAAACVRSLAYGLLDRLLGRSKSDRKREFLDIDRMEREAAAAEVEKSFALDATKPLPDLAQIAGTYHSPHSGLLSLSVDGNVVRAVFQDVEFYNCRLAPLGGEIFRIVHFDEPGVRQEVHADPRLRIRLRDGRGVAVDVSGAGTFERAA